MITFKHHGDFRNTERFFANAKKAEYLRILNNYGNAGVALLAEATPKDTGKTAASWTYKISRGRNVTYISWSNTNIVSGAPIAIMLQYGYGTRSGAYVQGRDYINPAIQPLFDQIADNVWKEVCNL